MKKIGIFLIVIFSILILSACNTDGDLLNNGNDNDDNIVENSDKVNLTLEQLEMYDGKDGNKAYIAVDGVIYDVTDEWSNGSHNGVNAGYDVTSEILNAPHGKSILENLEIIGDLIID